MMSAASRVVLAVMILGAVHVRPGAAQPTIDASAVAARAQPLPVLDDQGNVIPEDLIRATMRGPGRQQWANPLFGALGGLLVFTALAPNPPLDADCSIYEPCTERERFYRDVAPLTGMVVGFMVGLALPNGSVNRRQAVELLRARRRAERTGETPR